MGDEGITVTLSKQETLVLSEWLARSDSARKLPVAHPAEQKVLWKIEGQLEKQVNVFAPDYKQQLESALAFVDANT